MCDTEGNKHICNLDNLFDLQPCQNIHLKEKKQISHSNKEIIAYKFKNSFSVKKLPFIESLRINSLTCFNHQFNIIVVILSCGNFFH